LGGKVEMEREVRQVKEEMSEEEYGGARGVKRWK